MPNYTIKKQQLHKKRDTTEFYYRFPQELLEKPPGTKTTGITTIKKPKIIGYLAILNKKICQTTHNTYT